MGDRSALTVRAFRDADLSAVQDLIVTTIDASYTGIYQKSLGARG
jgi:hypothetical protein